MSRYVVANKLLHLKKMSAILTVPQDRIGSASSGRHFNKKSIGGKTLHGT